MLAYCDYIAHVISRSFLNDKPENMIESVGPIEMDLHPTEGWFVSTKKTISMVDKNGKRYRVTIEEE
jgi:hypothetical protein